MGTQSVISREVVVAAGAFTPGHLGELTRLVPFEMVDEALTQTGRVQERVRDLPSRVVVYLLLAGCLFPGLGWRQVWQRLTAGPGRGDRRGPDGRCAGAGPQTGGGRAVALAVRPAAWPGRRDRHRRRVVARAARLRDRRHDHGGARQPGESDQVHQAPLQWAAVGTAPTCRRSAPSPCGSSTAKSPSPRPPAAAPASTGSPPP